MSQKNSWKKNHDVWENPNLDYGREYRLYHPDTIEHMARTNPWIVARIIEEYTLPGQWVLDPMCGIGTTIIEALSRKRHANGIEPEERFAKIAWMNGNNLVHQSRMDHFLGKSYEVEFEIYCGYAQQVLMKMILNENYFDLITFSPPYEGINYTYRSASGRYKHEPDECRGFDTSVIKARDRQVKRYYSDDPYNIANFKTDAYWRAMNCIYAALRPLGDTMAVIVKNQIKNHKVRDFAQETIDNVVDQGWVFKGAHLAMLGEPSHWENVRRKKYPKAERVDCEHVLVFDVL